MIGSEVRNTNKSFAMTVRTIFLFYLLLSIPMLVLAEDHFELTPVPEWVKPVEIPTNSKVSKYDVLGGAYTALIDEQYNLVNEADFTHLVIEIVSNAGVGNASEISIPYDTAYQHLDFHYLRIWRNGNMIDRTDDLTFEFLRNENLLDASIYTGQVTAYDILEDIRKGDRVEYAYTITGDNPIFEKKRFRFMPLEQANPVDRLSLRIIHDAAVKFKQRCHACDSIQLREYDEAGNHIIELTRDNMPAGDFEETVPPWMFPYSYFSISDFGSWEDVNSWATRVFALEKEPQLDEVIAELKQGNTTLEAQIDAAINYVQDDIRYMGMENGIGSIKPFSPDQVIKQRFGDCKDKSLLLSTILRELGVQEAYPALVNTAIFRGVENMLPGGQVFNHCIVHFIHNKKDHWIDPTLSLQAGSFSEMSIPDYGRAMVVGHHASALKDMKIHDQKTRTEVTEVITFNDFDGMATMLVETRHYGMTADIMRSTLEYISRKELTDHYRESYGRMFPNIQNAEQVVIDDDEDKNILTTRESYQLTKVWKPYTENNFSGHRFKYEPLELYNYIGQTECEPKDYPVQVPFPSNFSQTTKIHLPQPLKVDREEVNFDNAAFTYRSVIDPVNESLVVLSFDYRTKVDEIGADAFPEVCNDLNEIAGQVALILTYSKFSVDTDNFRKALKSYDPKKDKRIETKP